MKFLNKKIKLNLLLRVAWYFFLEKIKKFMNYGIIDSW